MSVLDNIRDNKPEPDHGRVLLHGQPGTGKTTLASSIAKDREDGSVLFIYVPGEEGINSLNGVEWESALKRHRLSSIDELREIYWALRKEDHGFDAVVLDSVSALQEMWKRDLHGLAQDDPVPSSKRPAKEFGFWGALKDEFIDFFTFWYGLASSTREHPLHVVMTSQTKSLEDATGQQKMQPDLNSGPLGAAVSRADYILYTYMDDDPDDMEKQIHHVRLKPSFDIMAKTRGYNARRLPETSTDISLPGYLKALGVAGY